MNFVYLLFIAAAWVGIECFIGGTRMIYSLPAYGLISMGAVFTLASLRSRRVPPQAFCLSSTLLLGAWVLVRATHSPVEYLARPDFFMMAGCLMVYLITAYFLTGMRDRTILLVVLWGIAAAEVWVALIQFMRDRQFMLFGLLRPVTERPSGMYISPNNFAGLLVAVAIITVSMGIWSRWPLWARILGFYLAAGCLIGVAISGSRGGYFDSIGSLFCLAAGSIWAVRAVDPRRFMPVLIGSLAGVVMVVGLAAFVMSHSTYLTYRMSTMVYKDVRIYNWEAALDHIRVSPWVGTGSGTHLIYGRKFRRPQIQADPVHAHCDYLELLAEYGAVGGLCMALFLAAHARNGLRSLSDILRVEMLTTGIYRSNRFAFQLGACCAVVGLAIHSVVDFDMHIPGNALIFAFIFGALANPGLEREIGLVDRRVTPWGRLIAPVLGLGMLWLGMPMIPSAYYAEMSRVALRENRYLDTINLAQKSIGPAASAIVNPGVAAASVPDSDADAPPPTVWEKLLAMGRPDPLNPDTYFYIGEANRGLASRMPTTFLKKHYFERASAAYEAGLKIFPEDENMLARYGQALDGMGHFPEAEAIYQRAIAVDPHSSVVQQMYESHLSAEGNKEEADRRAKDREETAPEAVDLEQKGNGQSQ